MSNSHQEQRTEHNKLITNMIVIIESKLIHVPLTDFDAQAKSFQRGQ